MKDFRATYIPLRFGEAAWLDFEATSISEADQLARTIGDRLDMTLCSVELISKHFRKDKLTKHGPDYRDHDTTEKSKSHVEQTFLP